MKGLERILNFLLTSKSINAHLLSYNSCRKNLPSIHIASAEISLILYIDLSLMVI